MADAAAPTRPDLARPRRIHLIGVGGAGMSAIATVLVAMGHRVTGSDAAGGPTVGRLAALGVGVHVGHDPRWLDDAEVVAASTAIPPTNVEVEEAGRRGLRVWRRSELLAAVCARRRTVAVSGTHGKTTTSSMLALVLEAAGRHPSMIIGGDIVGVGPGAAWDPDGDWMVVEADESDGTFLALGAEAVVVTSVEADHLDFYGSEAALRRAFVDFVQGAPGPVVVCADDPGAAALAGPARAAGGRPDRVVTYGTDPGSDVRIVDIDLGPTGSRFGLVAGSGAIGPVSLPVPGLHYVRNAAAALAAAHGMGVDWEEGAGGIARYRGVGRRFERRGEKGGVTYIDDYGHLPAEVAATLAAARRGPWTRIVVVFQPHRYSRTEALGSRFGGAFAGADVLLVTDVYPAGEAPRPGVSGRLVVDAVRLAAPEADVRYVPSLDDAARELGGELRPGDLCLTLGAGDVTTLPDRLLAASGELR